MREDDGGPWRRRSRCAAPAGRARFERPAGPVKISDGGHGRNPLTTSAKRDGLGQQADVSGVRHLPVLGARNERGVRRGSTPTGTTRSRCAFAGQDQRRRHDTARSRPRNPAAPPRGSARPSATGSSAPRSSAVPCRAKNRSRVRTSRQRRADFRPDPQRRRQHERRRRPPRRASQRACRAFGCQPGAGADARIKRRHPLGPRRRIAQRDEAAERHAAQHGASQTPAASNTASSCRT